MIRPSFLVAILVAGLACGGDDSGVDDSTALADLSADDRLALCEEQTPDGDAYVRLNCYSSSIGAADCEAEAQACIDDAAGDDPCAGVATLEFPACASEVTVGEFDECYAAVVARVEAVGAAIGCDSDPDEVLDMLAELPAACDATAEVCPELFDFLR